MGAGRKVSARYRTARATRVLLGNPRSRGAMQRVGVGPEPPLMLWCNYRPSRVSPKIPISRSYLEERIFINVLTFVSGC